MNAASSKALQNLDAVLAAELAQSKARVAEGEAKKNQMGAATAMENVRSSANPNCQSLSAAIASSDRNNLTLLSLMQSARSAAKALEGDVKKWAANVKKPEPVAPPPPPAPKPEPPKVAAPKVEPKPIAKPPVAPVPPPKAPEVAKIEPPKAQPQPQPPKKPDPAPAPPKLVEITAPAPKAPPAPSPAGPRELGAAILPPDFSTPLRVRIEENPAEGITEVKTRPFEGTTVVACEDTSAPTTLPIRDAIKAVEALQQAPLPPTRPSNLQLKIAGEVNSGTLRPLAGVEAFLPARDIWGTEKEVRWKKYDAEKRAMKIVLPPQVSQQTYQAAASKLGAPLKSLEARVRLQKAMNAVALRLDRGKPRSPTVFQDGVLGSRTRNALVYYLEKHPAELKEALLRQGFKPSW